MRLLREPLGLGLDSPDSLRFRSRSTADCSAVSSCSPSSRRADIRFRPLMLGMVVAFTVMSGLYLSALGLGAAANAIFLQNTAPVWVYLFAVLILRRSSRPPRDPGGLARGDRGRGDRRRGMAARPAPRTGAKRSPGPVHGPRQRRRLRRGGALLRVLRDYSAAWLVALNLLGTAVTLGLFVLVTDGPSAFVAWVTAPSSDATRGAGVCSACSRWHSRTGCSRAGSAASRRRRPRSSR